LLPFFRLRRKPASLDNMFIEHSPWIAFGSRQDKPLLTPKMTRLQQQQTHRSLHDVVKSTADW